MAARRWSAGAIVASGLIFAVVFVRHELKQPHPIMPVDLLARPVLALSSAGALLRVRRARRC